MNIFYAIFIPKVIRMINLMLAQNYELERHEAHLRAGEPTIPKRTSSTAMGGLSFRGSPGTKEALAQNSSVKWLISTRAFLLININIC